MNAIMPWVIELRVVSLPATANRTTKKPNSSSVSLCRRRRPAINLVTMSSPGFSARSARHLHGVHDQLDSRRPSVVARELRIRRRRPSGWTSRTASCGPPAAHRSARRWPAVAVHTTPVRRSRRNPRPRPPWRCRCARSSSSSRSRLDGARSEPAGDDLAQLGVLRGVHVDQRRPCPPRADSGSASVAVPRHAVFCRRRTRRCAATPP